MASLGIAGLYFAISFFVLRGLLRGGQLRTNQLALATAMIFFSCGAGHLLHAEHVLIGGERFRGAADLHMTLWDLSTAGIAGWYLSLRARYGQLMLGPVMFEDQERLAAEAVARHEANHDTLTGLPNRQALMDALATGTQEGGENRERVLLFLDLDGFKEVNDRFGHQVGDELLVAAAERLRHALRSHDVLARLGGDEFVTLLGDEGVGEAEGIARRQAELMSAPFHVGDHEVRLTSSIGIALGPAEGRAGTELLHNADLAMYAAKRAGGDGFRVHTLASTPV